MKMKQAKTLFLNRAQLYTASGALRSLRILHKVRPAGVPEADAGKFCSIADFPVIPRGPSVPLRRCAAIPFQCHNVDPDSYEKFTAVYFFGKAGDENAMS